jgi:uracil-DNA glycosylase
MSATDNLAPQHAEAILQWYLDNGVDETVLSEPVNRLVSKPSIISEKLIEIRSAQPIAVQPVAVTGTPEVKAEAIKLAAACNTIDELKLAIMNFDGLSLKKTAMNMVFASGHISAPIMVIGDAPETEDDRAGVPFSGEVGTLTDKMFGAIGLSRHAEDASKSIYLTNVLNWRPPGNRSPLAPEIELSLPFIRRHIELVNPRVIFLMGGVACKSILGSDLSIGKLRGKTHMVKWDNFECPSMASFHPSFLIRSPLKKKEAWEDLLLLQKTFLQ